jgi:23S rRNA pseudouridine1911/1915/1917 synthase
MRGGKRPIPEGAPGHPFTGAQSARGAKGPAPKGPRGAKGARGPREIEREAPRPAPPRQRRIPASKLVYEDEEILAYDKSSGLAVIAPDGSRSRCLLDIATEQIRRRNPKGRAAVVHRIDRDTSGIVVFAKSGAVKRELMSDWDSIVAERLYVAVVEGEMAKDSGIFDSWLKEDDSGRVRVAKTEERGAKRAITRWRVLKSSGGLSLLELSLETGRKHQIRVQLQASGHPVVGDVRYGSRRDDAGRLCLHATAIELRVPGRKELRIESPMPEEFYAALRGAALRDAGAAASARSASSSASPRAARSGGKPPRGARRGK